MTETLYFQRGLSQSELKYHMVLFWSMTSSEDSFKVSLKKTTFELPSYI